MVVEVVVALLLGCLLVVADAEEVAWLEKILFVGMEVEGCVGCCSCRK